MATPLKIISIKTLKDKKLISENDIGNKTWLCANGRIYTELNPVYISKQAPIGYNPSEKAVASNGIETWDSSIIRPYAIVQEEERKKGFITLPMGDEANVSLPQYYSRKYSLTEWLKSGSPQKSYDFANDTLVHCAIDKIVSSNERLVFPDVATDGNIIIDSRGTPYIVDFCGIQVDKHLADAVSLLVVELVNNKNQYGKYLGNSQGTLYTKELDKASLIALYFYAVFGVRLVDKITMFENLDRREKAIHYILEYIGLGNEPDLHIAIRKIFEQSTNDWIGEQIRDIAKKYQIVYQPDLSIIQVGGQGFYLPCKRKAIRR